MITDLDDSNEYLDITIDDKSLGRCIPRANKHHSCDWHVCSISRTKITTSSSYVPINIQFSYGVSSYTKCTSDDLTGNGVVRITMIPQGKIAKVSSALNVDTDNCKSSKFEES